EATLLIPSIGLNTVEPPSLIGMVKLMMELHLQFDLLEMTMEWERYGLVIIPEELILDNQTINRIHQFVSKGGSVIVSHNGGVQKETQKSWLEKYGLEYKGKSPFNPAFLVADDHFVPDMPGYAYALYGGASQWKANTPAKSLANLGEPLFQRSAEHFTSHNQSPFDHVTDYSVLATSGNIGLIGFPIGQAYYDKGYWIYREAFLKLVNQVLPNRLVETNAPLNSEITVTYQPANKEENRPERYIVHIINWSVNRKTPSHPEVHEDPVALTDIWVKLSVPISNVAVSTVVAGEKLKHQLINSGIRVTIPKIEISEMVCFTVI
ncbi:MAG: beta-galactosidase trimerization domain-containing protein, partial [Prolixibacteraceae bacterium]